MGRYVYIVLSLILFAFTACKKGHDLIPEVWVDLRISLQNPDYQSLNAVNGVAMLDEGGVAGIVIVNTGRGFKAYDRCSTVNPEKRCAVELDETGLGFVDPCSGARYSLQDGMPTKAPATTALKQYGVSVSGNVIHVYN